MTPQWHPWKEYENLKLMQLDISEKFVEPPCKDCKFWKPHVRVIQLATGELMFDGVCMCISHAMHHDFSCYEETKHVDTTDNPTITPSPRD